MFPTPPYAIKTSSPLIRQVFASLNASLEVEMAIKAGIYRAGPYKWRTGQNSPRLVELEAFLEALGYRLALVKLEDKG